MTFKVIRFFFSVFFLCCVVSGSCSNRLTQASWRVALAICARCPVLFDDLKKLDILQLRCRRSLETVMGAAKTVDEGINEQHLLDRQLVFQHSRQIKHLVADLNPLVLENYFLMRRRNQ